MQSYAVVPANPNEKLDLCREVLMEVIFFSADHLDVRPRVDVLVEVSLTHS